MTDTAAISLGAQSDDGMYVLVGSYYSVLPPPGFDSCEGTIAAMRREFGDHFRPLWLTNIWRNWNGGLVRRVHHVSAHEDRLGLYNKNLVLIQGLVLPTSSYLGIQWRAPIFMEKGGAILDGLTNEERAYQGMMSRKSDRPGFRRRIARYEPFNLAVTRKELWEKRNLTEDERKAVRLREAAEQADWRRSAQQKLAERGAYYKRADRPGAPRVFVSDTLKKLREAAGVGGETGAAA